jgi:hypothetical protein
MECIQCSERQEKMAGTGITINILYHGNGALMISAQDHHGRATHAAAGVHHRVGVFFHDADDVRLITVLEAAARAQACNFVRIIVG